MNGRRGFRIITIAVLVLIAGTINLPKQLEIRVGPLQATLKRPIISIGAFMRDLELKKGLDIQGGSQLLYRANVEGTPEEERDAAIESAKKVIESRVNFFGISEPSVRTIKTGAEYRINVELPGVEKVEEAILLIGKTAQLDFRMFGDDYIASGLAVSIPTLENTISTGVTGKDMEKFQISFNTQDGFPSVSFKTTPEGREKFADVTRRLVGQPLITFLDDSFISAAIVQEEIVGEGQITGRFSTKEAKDLVSLFNAGALSVPLELIEQRNIGATLGKESVDRSLRAGAVGLGLVAFFMIFYYGRIGILSAVGLAIYGLLTLAIYRIVPITLTLPGIAGFMLSIGMAVDSNILIFERMKEELRAGKTWGLAMEMGFGKAWESIKDANLATLITTFILFNPLNWSFLNTSGLVRGFALTLFIGIVVSLFTGIMVTRTLMRIIFSK